MHAYGLTGGMKLETLPIKTVGKPVLKKYMTWLFDQRRVKVLEPFHAPRPEGGSYIIPAGFEFDGGSIPRWLLVLVVIVNQFIDFSGWVGFVFMALILCGLMIERFGLMLTAFAIHDFSVRYQILITGDGGVQKIRSVGEANRVMRRVNFSTNDMILLGWVAHMAVMLGAWMSWRRYRKINSVLVINDFNFGVSVNT